MKPKWSVMVDAKSAFRWYGLLVVYFIVLITCFGFYAAVSSVGELVGSVVYRYIIFIPAVFVVMMVVDVFEETFRLEPREYFRAFDISSGYMLFWRALRLFFSIAILYLPLVWYSCARLNDSLVDFLEIFPDTAAVPPIRFSVMLFQCLVILAFVVCSTMMLMFLFANKSIAVMLSFTCFAFDILVASNYFYPYNIFRGTVDSADFYHYLPPHIVLALILSVAFMTIACTQYNRGRKRQSKGKLFNA